MNDTTGSNDQNTDIIPQDLAIQAMRDSGYRNTAYAIAELIDNSVQANASLIKVFCIEETMLVEERRRRKLTSIAVVDNGDGMSAELLRKALQFGNGSRLTDRSGIGRFGMGLPNSSIAQASRMDVWIWQNGQDNALHTNLDVNEISKGKVRKVPEPVSNPLPREWRDRLPNLGLTGTLVVWSNLSMDRITWKSGRPTLKNTSWLIGRIHRKWIQDGRLEIQMICEGDGKIVEDFLVPVNDPLYLVAAPRLPVPFNTEPMFEHAFDENIDIELNGKTYEVTTRYSHARPETVDLADGDRGKTEYGRDADRNMGVSLLRAGRELMLDRGGPGFWTSLAAN